MLDEQKLIFSRQCSQGMTSTQQKLHQVNNKQKLPWPFWSAFSDFKKVCNYKRPKKKKREKTFKFIMAFYYEVQILKTNGFSIRVNAES